MKGLFAVPLARHADRCRRTAGISVVELLVAMAVGMVVTLAASRLLVDHESRNRGTLAANDINQTGAYGSYLLDAALRSAGSGFASRWSQVYGCRINATRNGATLLPRTAAWPAPFAGFTQNPRVAPVLIGKGQASSGSDVIAVMRGNSGVSESALEVLALGPPLGVRNTLGMGANQLLLLADGNAECLLLQSGTPVTGTLPLDGAGSYHTTTGRYRSLADFSPPSAQTVLLNLGDAGPAGGTAPNPPQFTLFAVDTSRTLMALDLLAVDGSTPQPIAEGVVEMRALYGVDTNGDGILDGWRDPGVAPFDSASLLAGTPAALANLNAIVAVRVGLVLRSDRAERTQVAPASVVLFADLDATLQQTRTLSASERYYRHRSTDQTIPLRNVLLARAP